MKRVVEVQFEREVLTVTYERDALIHAMAERAPTALLAERVSTERLGATVDALIEALVSWDLHGNEGRPYPIDRGSFNRLPIAVLFKVSEAISADAFEGD